MLQNEIQLMLQAIVEDKKNLKKFYKKGYFSYLNKEDYKGIVAIVNEKAVISFLEAQQELKIMATIKFNNGGTYIYKLFGNNYSFSEFGKDSHTKNILDSSSRWRIKTKEEIEEDLSIIRKYCEEAEKKIEDREKTFSIIKKISGESNDLDKRLSVNDVHKLLIETIDKVNKTRKIKEEQDSELDR